MDLAYFGSWQADSKICIKEEKKQLELREEESHSAIQQVLL